METVIYGKKSLYFVLTIFLANMCMSHVLNAAEKYWRPYGPRAPWNIPVKGIPIHPDSDYFASLLWNDSTASRPGNFNTGFDGYTYPVYEVTSETDIYRVEITNNWGANMDGKSMPWNPDWIPAEGDDAQIIVLDPEYGYEWNFWQVNVDEDNKIVYASNGNLVQRGIIGGDGSDPGNYWTKENGFKPSRGCGIEYLAMLVRPQEVAAGKIEHALSMPIINTDGDYFVPPATKLEHPNNPSGIPEGMRFALDVTDEEIEIWVNSFPPQLSETTRNSARILARALRDYGWFVTDTSGGAFFQFESRLTAGAEWDALGLNNQTVNWIEYPRDLFDGLITEDRIYALVPSDEYPTSNDIEPPSHLRLMN